ncbi:MAG: UbiA prenyltransferase family protein [Myxococcales bacterium]|jgi:4-hydroxybenzoate polyprenyltransferase
MLRDLIQLSRPKHWIKNIFVFLPVPFAMASGAELDPVRFAAGLFALCLASSAVYGINDAQDAERDRMHEEKRNRPIAAGRISKPVAYGWSAGLIAASAALALTTGSQLALILVGLYLVINLTYSFGAKHVPLLDVFLLSSLYMLRVLLGCALVDVPASNWLLVVSYALALFLSLAKRRADVIKGLDATHRPALQGYNQGFLDQAMGISASMTVIAYAMYSADASLRESVLVPGREFAPLPFVVFGVLDYLRMAHVNRAGGNPVDLLLRSPTLLVAGVGWLAATVWSLHLP